MPGAIVSSHSFDPFGALTSLDLAEGPTSFFRLSRLEEEGVVDTLDRLPGIAGRSLGIKENLGG